MKKSNLLVTFFSAFACALSTWFPCSSLKAQCTPSAESISEYDLTYQVSHEEELTRVRFFLDYEAVENRGAYGFQLEVFLTSAIQGITSVEFDLSGSWLFACASVSADVDYDSDQHRAIFEVLRVDCKGAEGDGFVGELILYREAGSGAAVEMLSGSIVMVDNVDAG